MSIDHKIAKWLKRSTKSKQFETQTNTQEVTIAKASLKTIQENLEEITNRTSSSSSSVQTFVLKYDIEENSEIFQCLQKDNSYKTIKKDKQIIQAITELNKNIVEETSEKDFTVIHPIYITKDINVERDIYTSIDYIMRKEFRSENLIQTKMPSYSLEAIKNIQMQKDKEKRFEYILFKGMIVSLENIILECIVKVYKKYFIISENDKDNKLIKEQCGFFGNIYQKYLIMSNIFPFLDKHFLQSFNEYKKQYELQCSLCELFSDLFWDSVFQIKKVNAIFIEYFNSNDMSTKISMTMRKIIDILWLFEHPLKDILYSQFKIGELENKKKKCLSQYVIECKNSTFCSFDYASSLLSLEKNQLSSLNSLPIPFSLRQEVSSQILKPKPSANDKELEATQYQSIEDLYAYITNDQIGKSKKKAKKKKRKNTISNDKLQIDSINTNGSSNDENNIKSNSNLKKGSLLNNDPIVTKFKSELCDIVNANDVKKIKPMISIQWIHSISLNS